MQATKSGVTVVGGYGALQRGNDAAFTFEQEANFWWLTGIDEPDWWVIIDGQRSKSWLVAPNIGEIQRIFDGGLDSVTAKTTSGVEGVLIADEAMAMLRDLTKKHGVVYGLDDPSHTEHFDFALNPAPKKLWQCLDRLFADVLDCRLILAKLRAIKQPEEIAVMKKAIQLTTTTFAAVKDALPQLATEYEVEAEFSYRFRRAGAKGHAYDPIVAGGKNACTLHYNQNTDRLQKGNLILIDIGARVGGYAADVTRTFAIGSATARQKAVHAQVEAAHHQIIKLLKPGLLVRDYHEHVDMVMKQALVNLKLMATMNDEKNYRRYFPHAVSHGLGIDVHDSLGQPTELLPGMVLTVEPGIYIADEKIGVRIEDDILITDTGHQNLSVTLPTGL